MSETVPPTTADEPTTAEIDAVLAAWEADGYLVTRGHVDERDARGALVAALPLLRERIAQEIAEIKDEDGPDTSFWHGTLAAGMVARGATHRNGRALVDEWFADGQEKETR